MNNSEDEKKAIGSIIKVWTLTLLVLTLCTCSGRKSTLVNLTLEKPIDFVDRVIKDYNYYTQNM